jgi:hypothetical protein
MVPRIFWTLERAEPIPLDGYRFYHLNSNAQAKLLQQSDKAFTVDEIDWGDAVTSSFLNGRRREARGGNKYAAVCSPGQSAAKFPYFRRANVTTVTLTLKDRAHAYEVVEAKNPASVDPTIAGPTCNLNFREAGFAKQTLSQAFKSDRWEI